jgi:hypothetical protein
MRRKKPIEKHFGLNKKSFDSVMTCYKQSQFTGAHAQTYDEGSYSPSTPAVYRGKPTTSDFRIDCDLVFRKIVPPELMPRFRRAYV